MELTMPNLEQIQARMEKLQIQADVLTAKMARAAVDQIRKIMLAHGLTTEDIEAIGYISQHRSTLRHSWPDHI
jgi:hypothetical protein